MKKDIFVLVGAGQIGMAIARRMGYGMKIIVADKNIGNAESICNVMNAAGFDCTPVARDLSSRTDIMHVIDLAQQQGDIRHVVRASTLSRQASSSRHWHWMNSTVLVATSTRTCLPSVLPDVPALPTK